MWCNVFSCKTNFTLCCILVVPSKEIVHRTFRSICTIYRYMQISQDHNDNFIHSYVQVVDRPHLHISSMCLAMYRWQIGCISHFCHTPTYVHFIHVSSYVQVVHRLHLTFHFHYNMASLPISINYTAILSFCT